MTQSYGGAKHILTNYIETQTYEKYLSNQVKVDMVLPEKCKSQEKLTVKDEYTFDFVELPPKYSWA